MGLRPEYEAVRSQILSSSSIPSLLKVFSLIYNVLHCLLRLLVLTIVYLMTAPHLLLLLAIMIVLEVVVEAVLEVVLEVMVVGLVLACALIVIVQDTPLIIVGIYMASLPVLLIRLLIRMILHI